MDDEERFRLAADPETPRARLERAIRDRHAERDRVARRDPDYRAVRDRSFIVMAGETLLAVLDPAEGATPESVVALLKARVEEAGRSRLRTDRWWDRDLCVWQGGKLLATVTRARDGRPVVTLFDTR